MTEREAVAQIIYELIPYDLPHGLKPKWVPNGNSLKQDECRRVADRIAALANAPPASEAVTPGLTKAMEIVDNMRQSEAGLFDAKHSGQRGEDRSTALYDAYQAIRAALASAKAAS